MQKTFLFNWFAGLGVILGSLAAPHPALAFDELAGNWRGGYIGGFAGGASAEFRSDPGVSGPSGSDSAFMGGGDIGNNWETGMFVLGVEADAAGLFIKSESNGVKFGENWMATVRGRAGLDCDRFLPYLTAGAGFTNIVSKTPNVRWHGTVDPGYAIGGGLDATLSHRWFGRIEYLYVDVPKQSSTTSGRTVTGGSGNNILRVGLNYRF